jgi:hypothetical protein
MNHRRREALQMLAAAGGRGCADPSFLARFTPELLDFVEDGLVTVWPETVRARGRKIEIARIRLTAAGRIAIEGLLRFALH